MKQKSNIVNLNKIHLNNKFNRNDKDLLNLLKLILSIRKRKRSNKAKYNNSNNSHDSKIISDVNSSFIPANQPNTVHLLPQSHNVNQYRMIENELNNLRNQINDTHRKNALPMIENKHETPINWTHKDNDAFELIKRVAKHRDINAANELVKNVPEFKDMMTDLTELGSSSAKEYIKTLHKDINILEKNRSEIEETNSKMSYEINNIQDKLNVIENNKSTLEEKITDLEDELNSKSSELYTLNKTNSDIQDQNYQLLANIDVYKQDISGLEKLYNSTKQKLDSAINQEQDLNNKLNEMNEIIADKHNEIELLNELKEQAEQKVDDEYNIRRQAEEGFKEIKTIKKQLAKENVNINRSLRIEKINNMTRPQLLKILKLQDLKKPYLSADQLKNMLIDKEGLNIPLTTPPATPERIEKYMNNDIIDYS